MGEWLQMKITNFVIAFVIILLPLLYVNNHKVNTQRLTSELELRYNAAVDTAVNDAARALKINIKTNNEVQYESSKNVYVNVPEGIKAFWNTMYLNFESQNDKVMQGVLKQYVPALAVIGYDGYNLYIMEKYINSANESETKHLLQPKKPYSYTDKDLNSISFTLDDFVTVFDNSTKTWHHGRRGEVAAECPTIPLLQDSDLFESVRRSVIVNAIQEDLQHFINSHNEHAKRLGISYTFTLPTISQEEWNNSIDDVGVMAFVQGLPVGNTTYNHYALGGSRLIKKHNIKGAINLKSGIKYYFRDTSEEFMNNPDYEIQETFGSEKEAAAAGYFPVQEQNLSMK